MALTEKTVGFRPAFKKHHLQKVFIFSVLSIAGLSTILRPSIDSKLTLFRLILPLLCVFLYMRRPTDMTKFLIASFILLIYSSFVSLTVSRFKNLDITYYLYYIVLILYFIYIKFSVEKIGVLPLYKYLRALYHVMIVLALTQYVFGGVYINTQDRYPAINIFFWNENEFSAVLVAFIPIYFLQERGINKFLWISLSLAIILVNDVRLAVISLLFFFVLYLFYKIPITRLKYVGVIIILSIVALLVVIFRNTNLLLGMTLGDVIIYPFAQILKLEPVPHIGSINMRLNAVIFGVQELIGTGFLGIGPGNSIVLMEEKIVSGTESYAAYSMHNGALQIVTELGFLGMMILYMTFRFIKKTAINNNRGIRRPLVYVYYISMLLAWTILSGPFSNYFFLLVFFFSIFYFNSPLYNRRLVSKEHLT